MKCLVTGGQGFIGSHLVKRLKEDGHKVVILDNKTGTNILDPKIGLLFQGIDIVFHLAALTRPQDSIKRPLLYNLHNVEGTLKVLTYCLNKKVKKVVFVSSTSLYGEQEILPTPETAIPNPMSPYALTKLIGEQYCHLFERLYGMKINIVRPFNVYGKGQDPKGAYAAAIPSFIDSLAHNRADWISGDGNQSRDFIYIDDVIDLIVQAGFSEISGETFNAGSGTSVSINEVYSIISEIMGKDIKPDYVDAVIEPRKTQGDIFKANHLLRWGPKIDLREGLRRTIEGGAD